MADESTTPANEAGTESKTKSVAENFPARRVFDSTEEAGAFLNRMADELDDFEEQTFALIGVDEEGNFDPEVYGDGTRVMIAKLMNRGEKVGGVRQPSTVKAIVCTPVPTLKAILESEAATGWADKILLKELNHVAVRPLRDADNVENVLDQMPRTLDAYITSSRDGGGGIMEAFNDLYSPINKTLAAKVRSWDKARLRKGDLKKALESAAYAADVYPQLEDRGEQPSLFVVALDIGIAVAKKKGLDPTIFERWKATRDQVQISAEEDDDDLDLDSLTDDLLEATDESEADGETAETETAKEPEPAE